MSPRFFCLSSLPTASCAAAAAPARSTWSRSALGCAASFFTWAKKRYFISTGESDRGRAQVEAERIYAEVVSGRRRKVSAAVRVSAPLLDLFGDWLATLEGVLDAQTLKTYRVTYVGRLFLDFFAKLDDVADESQVDAFARARLRKVLRSTVHKELGALRGFLKGIDTSVARDADRA